MLSTLRSLNDRFYESPSLLLGLCGIFWAGNAISSRLAVGQITPLTLVFLRWVLVLSVLWPIYGAQVRAHWPEIKPTLTSVILMGALGLHGLQLPVLSWPATTPPPSTSAFCRARCRSSS